MDFAWDSFVYLREYVKDVVRAVGMADVHVGCHDLPTVVIEGVSAWIPWDDGLFGNGERMIPRIRFHVSGSVQFFHVSGPVEFAASL